jgi:hypothetical protein
MYYTRHKTKKKQRQNIQHRKLKQMSKKRLKVPKGFSESINRRKTDNTMAKKGQKDKQRSTKHYT